MIKYLTQEELEKSLLISDLTLDTTHAIGIMLSQIKNAIEAKYNVNPQIIRNSPIVDPKYNYDRLYYPQTDITKSSRYTRWISNDKILRTQVTSAVPQILETHKENSIYMIPGLVYRRDVIDKTHVGEPHQLDIWKVSNNKYTRTDLLELVDVIVNTILPNCEWRYNETNHYYTKDGIEVEVLHNGKWLEILECGLILPKLLDDCGLDSQIYGGLALGLGLDRAVMLRKNITDIRLLRHNDPRIAKQMLNLDLYKEVSNYPEVNRDISIAILNDMNDELLGDEIRNLVQNSDIIEEIQIKSETNYNDLPKHVSERLGMNETMKNVLVGIKMRALGTSIKKIEANYIIEQLYSKIHKGSKGYI